MVTARMDTSEDTATGLSHRVTCETAGPKPTATPASSSPLSMWTG
ncbi:MAG: hypothetical protein ACLSF6_06165 [Evtepia gabavorous]